MIRLHDCINVFKHGPVIEPEKKEVRIRGSMGLQLGSSDISHKQAFMIHVSEKLISYPTKHKEGNY